MNLRRRVALAGHTGDVETARWGLDDDSPAVRATALGALRRLEHLTTDDLEAALHDRDGEVRARAAELAAAFGPAAVVGLLLESLGDPDDRVIEASCFAMGEMGDGWDTSRPEQVANRRVAVTALGAVSRDHRDPLCREAAVAAIGAIGDEVGLQSVLAATTDKPAVRRRAVLALAPFSGPEVDAALERSLDDRDWQVRQAAEDMTGRQT